jgi:hypothetical protein
LAVLVEWEKQAVSEAWDHTAWICAALANQNPFRGEKAKPASPEDFHPFAIRRKAKRSKTSAQESHSVRMPVSVLKGFFIKE